jgi:hypothetical protein
VLDAIAITLEAGAVRVGILDRRTIAGADGPGGTGRQRGPLELLASCTVEQAMRRLADGGGPVGGDEIGSHAATVARGCDN